MKTLSWVLLAAGLLMACSGDKQSRPENLLPMDKMVTVLSDIHQAEGIISAREYSKDSSLMLFAEIKRQIFQKRGVTDEQFKESYNWYTSHVEEYKQLYTTVVDTLNARSSEGELLKD